MRRMFGLTVSHQLLLGHRDSLTRSALPLAFTRGLDNGISVGLAISSKSGVCRGRALRVCLLPLCTERSAGCDPSGNGFGLDIRRGDRTAAILVRPVLIGPTSVVDIPLNGITTGTEFEVLEGEGWDKFGLIVELSFEDSLVEFQVRGFDLFPRRLVGILLRICPRSEFVEVQFRVSQGTVLRDVLVVHAFQEQRLFQRMNCKGG